MTARSKVFDLIGAILAVVALAYFARVLLQYWSQAAESMLRAEVLGAAAAGVAALTVGYVLSAMSWWFICRALGMNLQRTAALHIYFVSQFGKYLPGNVGHHVGRLAMGLREGLPMVPLASSQVIEMMVVVGTLSILALLAGWSFFLIWQPMLAELTLLEVTLPLAVLAVFMLLLFWLLGRWSRTRQIQELVRRIIATRQGLLRLTGAVALAAGNGVAAAVTLYLMIVAVGDSSRITVYAAGCVFVISWLAGFVTPGAPAGLGVRETVMLTLLSRSLTPSEVVAITLVFRLATTATDLLVLVLGWAIGRLRESRVRDP